MGWRAWARDSAFNHEESVENDENIINKGNRTGGTLHGVSTSLCSTAANLTTAELHPPSPGERAVVVDRS